MPASLKTLSEGLNSLIWIGQNGPLISMAPMETNCRPNSRAKTGPKPRTAADAEALVILLPPSDLAARAPGDSRDTAPDASAAPIGSARAFRERRCALPSRTRPRAFAAAALQKRPRSPPAE